MLTNVIVCVPLVRYSVPRSRYRCDEASGAYPSHATSVVPPSGKSVVASSRKICCSAIELPVIMFALRSQVPVVGTVIDTANHWLTWVPLKSSEPLSLESSFRLLLVALASNWFPWNVFSGWETDS